MEIERKFLVKALPDLTLYKHSEIVQAYVESPRIRVRKMDDKYYATKKSGGTIVREEIEWEISREEWEKYYNENKAVSIEKTRYFIPLDKYTAELDVYHGKNKGLLTVEVEFPTYSEALAFIPPDWFGRDVSENKEYSNKNLAINPRNC